MNNFDWKGLTPRPYKFDADGEIDLNDTFIVDIIMTNDAETRVYKAGVDFLLNAEEGIIKIGGNGALVSGSCVKIGFSDVKADQND